MEAKQLAEETQVGVDCLDHRLSKAKPINQKSPLKTGKKLVPKKPTNLKSVAKTVISDDYRKTEGCKKKRTRIGDLYDNDEAKFSVMDRAEEVLANVADEFPSFVKCMLPSNVAHGFWLIFPKRFCNLHLPMRDTTVILVDENGKEFKANYLVGRHGLSGGWRGFSLAHRIVKGDVLVFHLIKPCTLKVQIVRVYDLDEVDAALCLLDLVAHAKRTFPNKNNRAQKKSKKCVERLLFDIPQKNIKKNATAETNSVGLAYQSETNSDGFGSEVLEGSEISSHQANVSSCSQNPIMHNLFEGNINCRFTTGEVS